MALQPWYKVATARDEVRGGRSFNPDEFAIALEQVVAGNGPDDYTKPDHFFARTYFTRALKEHLATVLRRLSGVTANTAPVLALVTQFGGGKTHTLTALLHLVRNGATAANFSGVADLLKDANLAAVPEAKLAVFVGNAWDPRAGRETPWIDIARQLAGDAGVAALGPSATTAPPGTSALTELFQLAGGKVLILCDEVLNFCNRHRPMAEPFYAFVQNLTVAMTGSTCSAAVISLPRSEVEMTDWDTEWQQKITKVVRRVAKDLLANDEAEISEVVRRRLFQDLGSTRERKAVARAYADWCFDRRSQLPPEWTAVDTSVTETKAREYLEERFAACYPFHPATLSVFQRKWQALPQFQQTRGTLAMLAQWVSSAVKAGYEHDLQEPLITLGSAPLEADSFRLVVLGQLGESRLAPAISADIAGRQSHARALDADTTGPLMNIHRRVGSAILFESSGGQADRVAHLPELRFALGGPGMDTTSVDTAASTLAAKAFYIRPAGTDGYLIFHRATPRKVMNDRKASLDPELEVKPAMHRLVEGEFERGRAMPMLAYPEDGSAVPDSPKLTLVLMPPEIEWHESALELRQRIGQWTRQRGKSDRLYPGALVWCLKKQGRELREKVELWLAWKRVDAEVQDGTLGKDYESSERKEIVAWVRDAEGDAKDEVWASYRYIAVADKEGPEGIRVIDLGAGHSSSAEALSGRVLSTLTHEGLLNAGIGAGYLERNWPPALKESGAWPLAGLRQSFLNGSLTRLPDPDGVLQTKIGEFVANGDFGLAFGARSDGTYDRLWYQEPITPDEITFEPGGPFLVLREKARALRVAPPPGQSPLPSPEVLDSGDGVVTGPALESHNASGPVATSATTTFRLTGSVPPEVWNRIGTRLLPKLRSGSNLQVDIGFSATFDSRFADATRAELQQALEDLDLGNAIQIETA